MGQIATPGVFMYCAEVAHEVRQQLGGMAWFTMGIPNQVTYLKKMYGLNNGEAYITIGLASDEMTDMRNFLVAEALGDKK